MRTRRRFQPSVTSLETRATPSDLTGIGPEALDPDGARLPRGDPRCLAVAAEESVAVVAEITRGQNIGIGEAGQGKAGRGLAWHGTVRAPMERTSNGIQAGSSPAAGIPLWGVARQGKAGLGADGHG